MKPILLIAKFDCRNNFEFNIWNHLELSLPSKSHKVVSGDLRGQFEHNVACVANTAFAKIFVWNTRYKVLQSLANSVVGKLPVVWYYNNVYTVITYQRPITAGVNINIDVQEMNNHTGPVVNQVKKWCAYSWSKKINFMDRVVDNMVVHLLLGTKGLHDTW